MANTPSNVSVCKPKVSGAIYRAPLGTTLPTDATTALAAAFVAMGYASDEGVTNSVEVDGNDIIRAWGGDPVEQLDGEKTDNFEVTFIEAMNVEVLKTVFGASNVTETSGAITINVNNAAKANYIYVIDMLLKGNRAKRIVIPNGAISEVGETVYADDDVISYPVTITALADASGNTHYEYIAAA